MALAGSASALALAAASPAFAAEGAAADQGTATVEELVVTAEKREMLIQDVPAGISALSGQKLENLGITRLTDISAYIPGFNITDGGSPGQTSIVLRGIAPVGPGAVVGSYIDDTPIGSSTAYARATIFALDLMPYDLERFEVLRGPQGTLYGAGAMGGLTKYVLRKADPTKTDVRLGGETSWTQDASSPNAGLRGSINIPVIADKLAIRASAFNNYESGYIDNVIFTGPHAGVEEDTNNIHQYGGRVALNWRPVDNVSVSLQALLQRTKSDDNNMVTLGNVTSHLDSGGGLLFEADPIFGDLVQSHAFLQPFTKDLYYYAGTIDWDAGPVQVISATSWQRAQTHQVQDATETYGAYTQLFGLAPGVGVFDLNLKLDKFTQEFRIVSPSGKRIEWIAGAFYTHETSTNEQLASVFDGNYQEIGGDFAPFFTPFFAYANLPTTYNEYAAFGDLTFNITEQFDITGGIRYAKNDQDFAQISDGLILGGFTSIEGHSSEDVVTWMVNARYRFTPDTMIYGRVATGYRPGGPNVVLPGVADVPPQFDSDTLISYEVGVKGAFWDKRLLLNLTAFDIEWSGIQLGILNPARTASYIGNAGDAFSRGFELEGVLTPTEGLRIGFNAAYTKAELTSSVPGAPPFILGYQLPEVPEWTIGATADYDWNIAPDWKANVGASFQYSSEAFSSSVQDPAQVINFDAKDPAYAKLDLRAGVSHDNWQLNLFARNVTNERALQSLFVRQNAITGATPFADAVPLRPRTIGLSLDVDF
jgi:outer membrane receptor protein involved in Fe transport